MTWRGDDRRRRLDGYALVRGAFALLILLAVLAVLAVPVYLAVQVALVFVGVNP